MIRTWSKLWASAVCELRVQLGSARFWVALGVAVATIVFAHWILRYAQGPGSILSVTSRLFDPKYMTSIFGSTGLVVFYLGIVFLGCDLMSKDSQAEVAETVQSHAVKNHELIIGRALALFLVVMLLFVVCIIFLIGTQRIASSVGVLGGLTSVQSAVTFVFLDAAPNFVFWVSIVTLLANISRNSVLVVCVGSALVLVHFWFSQVSSLHLSGFVSGVGPLIPQIPSEIVPSTLDHGSSLIHRVGLLLLASGVLVAALSLTSRRDESSLTLKWTVALFFIATGTTTMIGLLSWHERSLHERQAWARHHQINASKPIADLERVEGDIRIFPGERMEMNLALSLRGRSEQDISELLMSFNPGMELRTLELEGTETTDYSFEHGLLRIHLSDPLTNDHSVSVRLGAVGKPDARFGNLDDTFDLASNSRVGGLPYVALGQSASIFEPAYVALTPRVRWLPMPGANFGESDFSTRPREFFEVDLRVSVPHGWSLSAPDPEKDGSATGWETFRVSPAVPVPNFSLLAAEFDVKRIQVEDVELELLFHKKHAKALNYAAPYAEGLPNLIAPILKRAREVGLQYPYKRFALVEVPNSLQGYSATWPYQSTLSSPGMLMFREWSLPRAKFQHWFDRFPQIAGQTEEHLKQTAIYYFQAFLDNDRFGGSLKGELWHNFIAFQTHPTGQGAHALDFVIRKLAYPVLMGLDDYAVWFMHPDFSATEVESEALFNQLTSRSIRTVQFFDNDLMPHLAEQLFDGHSKGWEAMSGALVELDPRVDAQHVRRTIAMKGLAVAAMIHAAEGRENVGRFLGTLRERFLGRNYTLDDLRALAAEMDSPAWSVLDTWIEQPGIPGFTVEEVDVQKELDEDGAMRFVVQVTVRNNEQAPGVVSTQLIATWEQDQYSAMFPFGIRESAVVAPNSAERFTLFATQEPKYVAIHPYLSHNRTKWEVELPEPSMVSANPRSKPRSNETRTGPRDKTQEIVVDDLAKSFSVENDFTQPAGYLFINLLRPGFLSQPDLDQGLPRYEYLSKQPQIWSRSDLPGAYGRYRRTTAVGIGSATGGLARFETELPSSGKWKLHYHLPLDPRQAEDYETMYMTYLGEAAAKSRPWGKQGNYKLRIAQDVFEEDLLFDASLGSMGWNDIGTFDLEEGEVGVEVSNESDGTFVYADAVRWIRINEDN